MRLSASTLAFGALAFVLGTSANAQVIPNRGALDAILGGGGTTETFENYSIADFGSDVLGVGSFDSTSILNGQGPGLIVPGLTISDNTELQWNGNGYVGLPTETISGGNDLTAAFTTPTTAFGVDLLTYSGFPNSVTASIYDTGGNLLFSESGISVTGPTPVFFGYQSAGGIGHIDLDGVTQGFSPAIDNLEFGNSSLPGTPEPGSLALFSSLGVVGFALLKRRRSGR